MKILKFTITLTIFALFISCNNKTNLVGIKLFAPNLADSTAVFISGNIDALGRWQPNKAEMTFVGNHIWKKEFTPQLNASVEYKFTLGSWQKEGLDKEGNPFQNFSINTAKTHSKTDTIYKWGQRINKVVGQITGTVKYHKKMQGTGILDRDVIVWLPPNYDKNTSEKYAVLYMHDGQNIIDPKTSSFGIDWQIDESCDSLIKSNNIPPIIVVGINSSADRSLDYSPGKKGEAYMNFIINKVKPFIDSTYRTKSDRKHTFVGGSSMGGLISMMLVWEHAEVFYGAICMSPAFQYDNFDYIPKITSDKGAKKDIKIYLDLGTVGLETQLEPGVNAMINALNAKGYLKNKDYFYLKEENARHFEADWARRFPKALTFILN
ncbi:MAG: alpha/beta hydrolase [Flavobacteriaceae bacterium]|nr:alpha/beta hydrolase [Flavobacteriaceae bacterium]